MSHQPVPHPPATLPPTPRAGGTDAAAAVALVLGVCGLLTGGLTSLVGIVVAHAKRRGTRSPRLSSAALVVCWLVTVFWVVLTVVYAVLPALGG
ncbi:hypothetical protein [Kineococcus gypseus]|uniref:hypothetical protein n=1 Tax=Kineococcus gypseus TaxID=1637102 RepID=UPI003D7D211B